MRIQRDVTRICVHLDLLLHIHAPTLICTCTHVLTCKHPCTCPHTYTQTQTHTHTKHKHTQTHTQKHKHTHTQTKTQTNTHTHKHTHTNTHTHIHTHTPTHTHTPHTHTHATPTHTTPPTLTHTQPTHTHTQRGLPILCLLLLPFTCALTMHIHRYNMYIYYHLPPCVYVNILGLHAHALTCMHMPLHTCTDTHHRCIHVRAHPRTQRLNTCTYTYMSTHVRTFICTCVTYRRTNRQTDRQTDRLMPCMPACLPPPVPVCPPAHICPSPFYSPSRFRILHGRPTDQPPPRPAPTCQHCNRPASAMTLTSGQAENIPHAEHVSAIASVWKSGLGFDFPNCQPEGSKLRSRASGSRLLK